MIKRVLAPLTVAAAAVALMAIPSANGQTACPPGQSQTGGSASSSSCTPTTTTTGAGGVTVITAQGLQTFTPEQIQGFVKLLVLDRLNLLLTNAGLSPIAATDLEIVQFADGYIVTIKNGSATTAMMNLGQVPLTTVVCTAAVCDVSGSSSYTVNSAVPGAKVRASLVGKKYAITNFGKKLTNGYVYSFNGKPKKKAARTALKKAKKITISTTTDVKNAAGVLSGHFVKSSAIKIVKPKK